MQYAPSPALAGIVKHYLVLERPAGEGFNYRLIPDGNPGIVFHFGDPLIQLAGSTDNSIYHFENNSVSITPITPLGNPQPSSFIYGQITRYNDLLPAGRLAMLIVVLQPDGLQVLSKMPAHELKNDFLPLDCLFPKEAGELEEQILAAAHLPERIRLIEAWLLKKIPAGENHDHLFRDSLQLLLASAGNSRMEDLLKLVPVTERQLERKFKTYIGIGPKKFADILRFQQVLKRLQHQPAEAKISDIVYDAGYYDPAHLNNYCKKMTGLTPTQYKGGTEWLAVNFVGFFQFSAAETD